MRVVILVVVVNDETLYRAKGSYLEAGPDNYMLAAYSDEIPISS